MRLLILALLLLLVIAAPAAAQDGVAPLAVFPTEDNPVDELLWIDHTLYLFRQRGIDACQPEVDEAPQPWLDVEPPLLVAGLIPDLSRVTLFDDRSAEGGRRFHYPPARPTGRYRAAPEHRISG